MSDKSSAKHIGLSGLIKASGQKAGGSADAASGEAIAGRAGSLRSGGKAKATPRIKSSSKRVKAVSKKKCRRR